MRGLIVAIFLIVFATGCATPYQPAGLRGGFTESRLGPDFFTVRFNGNGYTATSRTHDFTILRAAELSLRGGYPFFVILKESDTTARQRSATTSYNKLLGWQTTQHEVIKPGQEIKVRCYRVKPPGENYVYDARFIQRELRRKYQIDPPPGSIAGSQTAARQPGTNGSTSGSPGPAALAHSGSTQSSSLAQAKHHAASSIHGAENVKVGYEPDRRVLTIQFKSVTSSNHRTDDKYRIFRENQRIALAKFAEFGIPVDYVKCMTDRPNGPGYLTMTTPADHIQRYALPETADRWQEATSVQLWTPDSGEWRKVKIW